MLIFRLFIVLVVVCNLELKCWVMFRLDLIFCFEDGLLEVNVVLKFLIEINFV